MEYIQDLISLTGDAELTNEELFVLNEFTDEKVGFKSGSGKDYFQDKTLRSAFRKLKNKGKFGSYIRLVGHHLNDSMNDFIKGIDE